MQPYPAVKETNIKQIEYVLCVSVTTSTSINFSNEYLYEVPKCLILILCVRNRLLLQLTLAEIYS